MALMLFATSTTPCLFRQNGSVFVRLTWGIMRTLPKGKSMQMKLENTTPMSVRLDSELHAKLKAESVRINISMNLLINAAVEEWLDENNTKRFLKLE